ncbi:hypothetical protein CEXT_305881 [Caerostris extrusa]|uniref:Uncharacterized protein n=1 Tax=Caerostris extrusa TaxID=172846 RepID=A0AAV4VJ90_CAEEX|nr:hypothetical protein CEXT_305881 [Caerostris extrusa]
MMEKGGETERELLVADALLQCLSHQTHSLTPPNFGSGREDTSVVDKHLPNSCYLTLYETAEAKSFAKEIFSKDNQMFDLQRFQSG